MTTNKLFVETDLLKSIRICCDYALCDKDKLPDDVPLDPWDIIVSGTLREAVFDSKKVAVIYSENESTPLVGSWDDFKQVDGGTLLSGNSVRQLCSTAQITVYSQNNRIGYRIGDRIMEELDRCARQRHHLRYFRLVERHSTLNENLDCYTIIYKFKVQLQP